VIDPTTILVNNLTDSLRQVTSYVTIGLATAVSALILDFRSRDQVQSPAVELPGIPIAVATDTAKWLLLGVCFIAGVMASYAAEGASRIVGRLQASPDILSAACTYASIATAPVGVRVVAALLPLVFSTAVMWRMYRLLLKHDLDASFGPALIFFVPYGALCLILVRLPCRA
jgi:hypothetical protein